jgi:hypothetical protein
LRQSPDVNGTAHCGPLVPLGRAAHSPPSPRPRDQNSSRA